jgi:hypothetical protein
LDFGWAVIEVSLLSSAKTYLTVGTLNPVATIKTNIDNAFEENKIGLRELEGLELCSEQISIFGEEVFKQYRVHGARLNSFLRFGHFKRFAPLSSPLSLIIRMLNNSCPFRIKTKAGAKSAVT